MNPAIRDWRGKRVWLLGASSGIGAALARELLTRGARVALSARNESALHELAGNAPDALDALVLPCDAADPASLAQAGARLMDNWGGVDVAIYLAADYQPMRAWELELDVASRMIDINLRGAIAFASCVIPCLLRQGQGQLAFVASVAGYGGLPKSLIYGPTKAALINFAETLYLDLAPRGIGVRLINPGFVATPLTAGNDFAMPALMTPEQAVQAVLKGYAGTAFEIDFPRRFTLPMKLLSLLPYRWYFPLVRRITGL
jgi:NAD(P)-dependent dehydrogenase (short-subunit alcohol dehydrogenase family)